LGSYTVTASVAGVSTPAAFNLVNAAATAPTVTLQPINQTATAGSNVSFTAAANGTPAPTVQWQISTDGGTSFNNISGATSTTLTLSNVTTAQSGEEYRAVFSNSAGTAATSAVTLTVTPSSPLSPPPPPVPPPSAPPASPALNVPPLLGVFDQLLGATETVNADGSVTETAHLFGFPLLVSTFSSSGSLESVTLFGINVTFLFELL